MAELAKSNAVCLPSLPGFGQSSRPEWVIAPRDMASWITWFIADQRLTMPLNVVGFGLGGWLAAEIASYNRQIFKKMVLVAPMGVKPKQGEIWDYFINSGKEAFQQAFHNPAQAPEFAQYYGKDWTPEEAEQVEVNREMACRLTWRPYMHSITLPWLLQGVRTPTLIVHGRQDKITPLNASEQYAQIIKGSQLKVIDNCGHMPEMEKTDEFVRTVQDFLKR
jgi:pimeloyl-ACP methyl ester carboxylesterase